MGTGRLGWGEWAWHSYAVIKAWLPIVKSTKTSGSTSLSAKAIREVVRARGNADIARHSAGFFKAGPGEYGEGDRFLGIRVPVTRQLAKQFREAPERSVLALLKSAYHEERLLAVLLLVGRYQRAGREERRHVFDLYLDHRQYVNNWDLVDSSAHLIVGPELEGGDRSLLYELAASESLWDRRIAIIATLHFIRSGDFRDTLKLSRALLDDSEDLIHKASGWMLREAGKRDVSVLRGFLKRHSKSMPRTMLRYAIERLPANERRRWLSG